jgi:drug/metabolite transporter superfamily protein YnfA
MRECSMEERIITGSIAVGVAAMVSLVIYGLVVDLLDVEAIRISAGSGALFIGLGLAFASLT